MAVNKNQLGRYRIIDECLQNRAHTPSTSTNPEHRGCWPITDLQEKIYERLGQDVSERSVKEDLKRMKDDVDLGYYAPIENIKGIGYFYADPAYKITERPLSRAETAILNDVIILLSQFRGFRYFEGAEGLIHRIEQQVNRSAFREITLDVLPDYQGLEHLEPIRKAINGKRVLKITYRAFYEEEGVDRHIHPYLLKEYNNRWFVYAWTDEYASEGIYGLERIAALAPASETRKYKPPDPKKITAYFADIIGVTNYQDQEVADIVLRVTRERAYYLATKPIHKSQKIIKESKNYLWFSFRLKPNNELASFILGLGKDAVVEKPTTLARDMQAQLRAALANYAD